MTERGTHLDHDSALLEDIPGRTIFEHSGALNMLVASDTTLLVVNSRFEEITGYSREEVEEKMSWTKIVHPDDLEMMLYNHRLRREKPALAVQNYEFRFITSQGEIKWGLLTGATLANGSRTLISVVDITPLKEKESALSRAESLYRDIVQKQKELITRVDPDLVLTFVNDAFCSYYGEKKEDILGRRITAHTPPEDLEKQRVYFASLTPENPNIEVDERTILHTGEIRWQHWEDTGIFDKTGKMIEMQSIGRDITDLCKTREKLDETIEKLRHAFGLSIEMAGKIIEVRDPFTAGHQRSVARVASAIAVLMGLKSDEVTAIELASLAHDVGKIHVPSEILSKPGVLQPAEWAIIRQHPVYSSEILKTLETPWDLAGITLQHHERYDGSGYPGGLAGEDIRIEARVLAVADVIEAMSSHRPYRSGFGIEIALDEIEAGMGKKYDPDAAGAALILFREKGFVI
ncbi:MAG: PAS domain S-box protein [Syntrophales bacterium]|nr:PAS domain S-box protein [Syntrophales bacterium]